MDRCPTKNKVDQRNHKKAKLGKAKMAKEMEKAKLEKAKMGKEKPVPPLYRDRRGMQTWTALLEVSQDVEAR